MLAEREQPRVSRGNSRAPGAGTASSELALRTTGSRTGASTTGALGSRSARKKRGLFRRTGIALPAGFLAVLLVVVVWGAAKVMNPQGTGANSLYGAIGGLGTSKQVSGLAQEYQTLVAMNAATQTLSVAAKPAHTDPDQIMAAQNASSDTTGGTSVTTMALPANPTAAQEDAKQLMPSYGFSVSSQWSCLYSLWEQESTWNVYAENAASGAYGIPQALPGDKMASIASDWQTNPVTQIKWGLGYIKQIYGTPCAAWNHEVTDHFY